LWLSVTKWREKIGTTAAVDVAVRSARRSAQIDPAARDLVQFGYNQAFEGHPPLAGYAFYYHNQPDFLRTNLTLRLAVAPVYVDSNLGFVNGLGPTLILRLAWPAAVFPTVTTKFAAAPITKANRLKAMARNLRQRVSPVQSNRRDSIELHFARHGALF